MKRITRRQILGSLPGVALGAAVASPLSAAVDNAVEDAPLVIGPFAIDGWFLKCVKTSPLGGPLSPLATPKPKDVAKVLSGCRIYVLDRRVGGPGKGSRFADGYPKAMAEGNLAGKWKDGEKQYSLYIADISVVGSHTDYDQIPPIRQLGLLTVTIHLHGTDGQGSSEAVYSFSSERPAAVYDTSGTTKRGMQ